MSFYNLSDIIFPHLGITVKNLPVGISIFGFEIAFYGIIVATAMLVGRVIADIGHCDLDLAGVHRPADNTCFKRREHFGKKREYIYSHLLSLYNTTSVNLFASTVIFLFSTSTSALRSLRNGKYASPS